MSHALALARANALLLEQGADAIAFLGPERYTAKSSRLAASSIGAHFRHVFEHYRSFLAGLPELRIDYDARARDRRLEQDAAVAQAEAYRLAVALQHLTSTDLNRVILVRGMEAPDARHAWVGSTAARELGFVQSHTIHHFALIALLAADGGTPLDPEFGVAPATLAYRQEAACAR